MTDYGHDLLFGAFVTPSARAAQQVVDLAVTADRSDLDLVTFQDHPYQSSFLDTSTLLAYVAARTRKVRVSANVTSLPLRPPAVLARAAASLDLLSGGRFELGIGAGAFWDGIASMGGRRLTPTQGVTALREGIEIIRELWKEEPGRANYAGRYYSLDDVRRGPSPAHDISVWVGAYKPRMLELTGAVADGWLPTVEYLPQGADSLPELNDRIDAAAAEAGRPPTAVRRLLNVMRVQMAPRRSGLLDGPPDAWVDDIVGLALDHGISAVLVGGDDPAVLERLGKEVAPAAREAITRERG
ncbi:LLM class flavin-dependent oxidoreductase [Blastococcus sp. SYSU DS0617]